MSLPVISVAQMREWEKTTWAAGHSEVEVIRRVGKEIVAVALRFTRPGDLILILSGPGNNGADARATLEHFDERRVDTLDVKNPAADLAELKSLLAIRPALIIDGLFGIGLNRPLDAGWRNLIETINASKIPVLAVDVPSGLDADTGEPQGAAIEASVTLTVGAPKTGLLRQSAWRYVGRLEVTSEVGLLPCTLEGEINWTLPADFAGYPPGRPAAGHKGTFGHAGIFSGSFGHHGAAVLAARGAQRAQPGLITLITDESVYFPAASQLQAVMVRHFQDGQKWTEQFSAVLVGPGLASPGQPEKMKQLARDFWQKFAGPVVIDASALDWIAPENFPAGAIRVLTPHPGEAARLLRMTAAQVQADRPAALRELSKKFGGCFVVLKGHQTLIGGGEGKIFVNSSGNPHLAQGGAGDVLAGFLAGLLAQPALQSDALRTIRFGVWSHGAAADFLQRRGANWVIEDLFSSLGAPS